MSAALDVCRCAWCRDEGGELVGLVGAPLLVCTSCARASGLVVRCATCRCVIEVGGDSKRARHGLGVWCGACWRYERGVSLLAAAAALREDGGIPETRRTGRVRGRK